MLLICCAKREHEAARVAPVEGAMHKIGESVEVAACGMGHKPLRFRIHAIEQVIGTANDDVAPTPGNQGREKT